MTVNQALEELLEASEKSEVHPENKGKINEDNICYGVARIGSDTQIVCVGKIKDIIKKDLRKIGVNEKLLEKGIIAAMAAAAIVETTVIIVLRVVVIAVETTKVITLEITIATVIKTNIRGNIRDNIRNKL